MSADVLHPGRTEGAAINRAGVRAIGHLFVWLTVFTSFYVQTEPAPYDLLILSVAALYLVCGLPIPRHIGILIVLVVGFVSGGFLSLIKTPEYDPFFFHVVTAYLSVTSIFIAAFVASDPARRLPLIMNSYLCAAVAASALGIVGYLGIAPEMLTRYGGRAMATFRDPNVFGAFLIAPAAYAFMLTLTRPAGQSMLALACYATIVVGVLLSFSRAAWIGVAGVTALVALFSFIMAATNRERSRLIAVLAISLPVAAFGVSLALSLEGVRELVESRTSLQSYDTGHGGRFFGQIVGFSMAVENPLGLGPYEFAKIYGADPHNVYLNALMSYGWLGALSYYLLVGMTIMFALRAGFRRTSLRDYVAPAAAAFIIIAAEGLIIDSDHWRHFYLLVGLIWGFHAARGKNDPARSGRSGEI